MFNIGDKVVRNRKTFGVVTNISPKRGIVTVDFEGYKERYSSDGHQISRWHCGYIELLTPEVEQKVIDMESIQKCKSLWHDNARLLTGDQARRIIEILQENDPN